MEGSQRRGAVFAFVGCLYLVLRNFDFAFSVYSMEFLGLGFWSKKKTSLMRSLWRDHRGTVQFSPLWVARTNFGFGIFDFGIWCMVFGIRILNQKKV